MTINKMAEEQARLLAADNRSAEPAIKRIFWFPAEHEVRMVALNPRMPPNVIPNLQAFYFHASPVDGLPLPTRVAMIRPEEFGQLTLPDRWGSWTDAVEI